MPGETGRRALGATFSALAGIQAKLCHKAAPPLPLSAAAPAEPGPRAKFPDPGAEVGRRLLAPACPLGDLTLDDAERHLV